MGFWGFVADQQIDGGGRKRTAIIRAAARGVRRDGAAGLAAASARWTGEAREALEGLWRDYELSRQLPTPDDLARAWQAHREALREMYRAEQYASEFEGGRGLLLARRADVRAALDRAVETDRRFFGYGAFEGQSAALEGEAERC